MRKHISQAVQAVLMLLFFISSSIASVALTLPDRDLSVQVVNGKTVFNGADVSGTPGAPLLPTYTLTFVVPQNVSLSDISVTLKNLEETELAGTFDIEGALPLSNDGEIIWPDTLTIVDGKDVAIYTTDLYYPASNIGSPNFGKYHDYKLVEVPVNPYRYNPVTKTLKVITGGTVVLTDSQGNELSSNRSALPAARTATVQNFSMNTENYAKQNQKSAQKELLSSFVVNIEETEYYSNEEAMTTESFSRMSSSVSGIYNYVIITTEEIKTSSTKLAEFVAAKEAFGYSVLVATESIWGGGTGNTASENIRGWLKSNYRSMAIEYVLLIGNPVAGSGDVPMKQTYPKTGNNNSYYEAPTDFYYAELSGNWDIDGDGRYGEEDDFGTSGGPDKYPEVAVGRIPFYGSVADLDHILQKTIDYGNASQSSIVWRQDVLLPMEPLSSIADGYHLGEALKDDIITPNNWEYTRVYDDYNNSGGREITGVKALVPAVEYLPCNINNVVTAWNNSNPGLTVWFTHGNETYAQDVMDLNGAAQLNDAYPAFVFQGSCLNASPDYSNNLSYSLLRNGAITAIGATRVSWYMPSRTVFTDASCNGGIAYQYSKNMIQNEQSTGKALSAAKSSITAIDKYNWMNWVVFTLYGDPSLSLTSSTSENANTIIANVTAHEGATVNKHPLWEPIAYPTPYGDTVSFEGHDFTNKWHAGASSQPSLTNEWGVWELIGPSEVITIVDYFGSITPMGSKDIPAGENQQYTFSPADGYAVTELIVDGAPVIPVPQNGYLFENVRENHTILVTFGTSDLNTLSIVKAGPGSEKATVNGAGSFQPGTATPISAIVPEGVLFENWSVVSGNPLIEDVALPTTSVTVNDNAVIQANFTEQLYTLSVTTDVPPSIGTVTGGGTDLTHGSMSAITATVVDNSYEFTGWSIVSGNPTVIDLSASATNVTVTGNAEIKATFTQKTTQEYLFTATAGPGGSISPTGETPVTAGETVLYRFTPNDGYGIKDVVVDGKSYGVTSALPVEATGNRSIHATFQKLYSLTVNNGTGTGLYPEGFVVDIAAAVPAGETFTSWSGPVADPVSEVTTVVMPASDVIVAAQYGVVHTITATAGNGGTLTPSGAINVPAGKDTTISITPNPGFEIESIVVDGVVQAIAGSYTFKGIAGNHTIDVTFKERQLVVIDFDRSDLEQSFELNHSANLQGQGQFPVGSTQQISIAENLADNYYFVRWELMHGYGSIVNPTSTTTEIVIGSPMTIKPIVKRLPSITVQSGPNGAVSDEGINFVELGADTSFTITPAAGYEIDQLVIDGNAVPVQTVVPFRMVTADHTIYVTFKQSIAEYPAWDSGTIYTGGDKVSYDGKNWSAKWWTKGNIPGKSSEWAEIQ